MKTEVNLQTGAIVYSEESQEELALVNKIVVIPLVDQIRQLESASGIPRITREFMLQVMEKEATDIDMSLSQLADANIGYKKLKALDTQIRALRAQL